LNGCVNTQSAAGLHVAGYDDQEALEFGAAAAALKHSIPGDFNLVGVEDVQRLIRSSKTDIRR
jgi:2-dehydro-3-deoxygluconokinase